MRTHCDEDGGHFRLLFLSVGTDGSKHTLTHMHINTCKAHAGSKRTPSIHPMQLALARLLFRRKNSYGITQGNNQGALPWNSCPSLGNRTSEAWVEVWRGVGRGSGKLGREGPPAERSF